MNDQASTYRKDLYYICFEVGNGLMREITVPAWWFYTVWFLSSVTRWRRYRKLKNFNVLREEY